MSASHVEGLVVRKSSRDVRVQTADGVLLCSMRGRFRDRKGGQKLPVVVGDRVLIQSTSEGEAVLERILPRRSELRRARYAPGRASSTRKGGPPGKSERVERVIAANVDQVLVMLAARTPPPRWGLVDRVLVSSQYERLEVGICLNKWDQVADDAEEAAKLEEAIEIYRGLGYPTFRTSLLEAGEADALEPFLANRVTVLSGHSGVGKSTLLNAVVPGEDVATGRVSEASGRGRHVTVAVGLYALPQGGYLVDTPGYREYGLLDLDPHELGRHYPDFEHHIASCRFSDCLHQREPKCAVRAAWERGEISELRYRNYLQILTTLMDA